MRKMKIDILPGEFTSETAARAKEGDILFLKAGVHRILSPVTIRQKIEDRRMRFEEKRDRYSHPGCICPSFFRKVLVNRPDLY